MKRIIPLLIILGLTIPTTEAQRLTETDDLLDKKVLAMDLSGPQMALMEMKRELNLSEEQLLQVEQLHDKRYQRMAEAQTKLTDPIELQRAYRDIQTELDKVMAGILNEKQLKHFLELEGRQYVNLLTGNEEE
ncbi:hypothetical protein [Pontibacter ramchanderi]|uniref:Spy/CpxP family protein refolding chaperone n=1 Tax=Pontibacter ramchanderi TaxID=1179743 RepID=A0A2N3V251_9BACT|nr:hypothetical protein [Pontibacter ramchanderi]PKV75700.1 hypothetical protein BD749_0646 [Pontibacter ramchanderi]